MFLVGTHVSERTYSRSHTHRELRFVEAHGGMHADIGLILLCFAQAGEIKHALDHIKKTPVSGAPSLGILTTMDRDAWAK